MNHANDNQPAPAAATAPEATTATGRTARFDAELAAYLPSLRRQANFIARNNAKGEELLHEAVMRMLRRASGCDVTTFRIWAQLNLRSTARDLWVHSRRQMRNAIEFSMDASHDDINNAMGRSTHYRVPADQDDRVDLATAMARLAHIRNGDILLRHAAGETLEALGAENGTTREAVRQRVERARKQLSKSVDWVA